MFEDAHWADSSSLELLDRIVDEASPAAVCVVWDHVKKKFAPPWVGPAHVTAISLRRLARWSITSLVFGITGGAAAGGSPRAALSNIWSCMCGLFVEELTKSIVEGELCAKKTEFIVAFQLFAVDGDTRKLCSTSLMARLDRLPLAEDGYPIRGCNEGREFPADLLVAVAQRSGDWS